MKFPFDRSIRSSFSGFRAFELLDPGHQQRDFIVEFIATPLTYRRTQLRSDSAILEFPFLLLSSSTESSLGITILFTSPLRHLISERFAASLNRDTYSYHHSIYILPSIEFHLALRLVLGRCLCTELAKWWRNCGGSNVASTSIARGRQVVVEILVNCRRGAAAKTRWGTQVRRV